MNIRTLIAVAIIDRTGTASVASVAKASSRVRADVAGLADVLMVLDNEGTVTDAAQIKAHRVKDGGFAFTLDTVAKAPAVVGLDFSEIVASGPNPVRLLELDVDGRNHLVAADVLAPATITTAKAGTVLETKPKTAKEVAPAEAPVHTCKATNFFGEPCQVRVEKKGATCRFHSGTKCGAEATGTDRPCQMTVAVAGDHCKYHGGPAKKARKNAKKAA